MSDIFKDMQTKVGCDYISDLPSYKRKVWQEMKRLNLADYEERQLEDFSKYVFGMSYQTIKDVMKQQKGREEQCRKQVLISHSTSGFFLPFVRILCVAYGLNNSISVCSCFSRIFIRSALQSASTKRSI